MAIGITSYAYRWALRIAHLDVFALLDRAHEAGSEVVQICDNLPLENLPDSMLRDLAQRASELGLTLEMGIKGSQPENFRRNLDIVERLRARLLRVVLTRPGWEPSFAELVAIFKSLLPDLRSAGVTLAIENHFHLLPSELAGLIKAIDDPIVGACLDPVNSISKLVGSSETVAILAPLAVSVHVKDAIPTPQNTGFYICGCPLGEGLVDVPGMLAAVRAAEHSPNILVESWMDRLDDEAATLTKEETWVRQGITYLRRLLDDR